MAFSSWRTWVTGEVVTAAHMNQEVRDNGEALFPDEDAAVSWTPTLEATTTNPTAGAGTGRRWRVGPLQFVWVKFVLSSGAEVAGSGTYFVTLPVAASGISASSLGQAIGAHYCHDVSATANSQSGTVILSADGTSDTVRFRRGDDGAFVSDSTPFAWAENDVLSFQAVYPVA